MMLKKKKKVDVSKLENRFVLVLDDSASMAGLRAEVVAAMNAHVQSIRENAKKSKQKTTVTLIKFATKIDCMFSNEDVSSVSDLTLNEYTASGGSTRLFDAVRFAIEKGEQMQNWLNPNVSYVVTVITDGQENDSRNTTIAQLTAEMQRVIATDRWTMSFLLPPGAKKSFVAQFNIPAGNVREWEGTAKGIKEFTASLSAGNQAYYASRAVGQTVMSNYLQTDLSDVSKKTVVKKLTDISGSIKVWNIDKHEPIKDVAERRTRKPYILGSVYYQLMKREEIQAHKGVIIMDKKTKHMYTGPEARDLIGLPDYNAKVEPGNHAGWEIFVQSTSPNRKLIPGTKVLFYPPTGPVKPTWGDLKHQSANV